MIAPKESVTTYTDRIREYEEQTQEARDLAEKCWAYYDGDQLSDDQIKALKARRQPAVVKNWIKREVDTLIGLEKSQRTDPRAYPRTPGHEQGAEAATDSLRYVADREDYDQKRSQAWFDMLVKGFGGVELKLRPNELTGELDIVIEHMPWDRCFFDPHSARPDFSDARYLGVVVWQDFDMALARYGEDAKEILEGSKASVEKSDTLDDKPTGWFDKKRNRVRIAQMYHKTPQGWMFCEFTGAGVLHQGPSPFMGADGKPDHPYVWRSAYVDQTNNRYGIVREMLDIQDEINKRTSKLLHLANVDRTWSNEGVIKDERDFKRKMSDPAGHVKTAGEFGRDWGVIPVDKDIVAHGNLLQEAKQEMSRAGPNPSLSGEQQSSRSGRAIQAEQQASLAQLGGLLDALRDMDKRVYRKVWLAIRQFWTAPKWVRVTDDERNVRFAGLNTMGPNGEPPVMVAELDVDIIVEDAPDQVTLQGEQFANLVDLARVGVQLPPEAYIQAAPNLRNKDKILEVLQQAGANPMQQAQAQLGMQKAQADIDNTEADTLKKQMDAFETRVDAAMKSAPPAQFVAA